MQNLVLYGGIGNGKTHMAIACGSAACGMGLSVMFTTISDLVVRMQRAEEAGTLERVFREVERADLVILDELGYLPIDRQGARLLFQVVSKCYERRNLIVTTNLEFSRWGSVLTDDQMASAMAPFPSLACQADGANWEHSMREPVRSLASMTSMISHASLDLTFSRSQSSIMSGSHFVLVFGELSRFAEKRAQPLVPAVVRVSWRVERVKRVSLALVKS